VSGDRVPSVGLVKWWMRNHTNFPRDFENIEKAYKQQARTLADKFKRGKPNENDE